MKIGILSQWFPPESGGASIPGVLARGLAMLGHDVTVLTGYPNYPTGRIYPGYSIRPRHDYRDGPLSIRRVALYPDHSARVSGRLLNYGSFAFCAAALGTSALRGMDSMWVYNSPPTVALPMWLAKARYGLPTVLHIMDMWPDSAIHTGYLHGRSRGLLRGVNAWVDRMYESSEIVAHITPTAGDELERRGVPRAKLRLAPIWVDESIFFPHDGEPMRTRLGFRPTDIVLGYAGALGAAQDVLTLARVVTELPRTSPIRLLVLGSGVQAEAISELSRTFPNRITFLGYVPHEAMTQYAAVPDISYVGLTAAGANSMFAAPSKLHAIFACSKPVLAALPTDMAKLINTIGAGFATCPRGRTGIEELLQGLEGTDRGALAQMGQKGRAFYQRELSSSIGIRRVEGLLREASVAAADEL